MVNLGAQFVEAMVNTDYMQLMKAELLKPRFDNCPTPENVTSTSIAYWRCVLLYMATTGNHLTSTNAILSVVEPNLKYVCTYL